MEDQVVWKYLNYGRWSAEKKAGFAANKLRIATMCWVISTFGGIYGRGAGAAAAVPKEQVPTRSGR